MHRIGTAALTAVALLTGGLIAVGCVPAAADAPTAATTCSTGTPIQADFDGDGIPDLVVGASRSDGGAILNPHWIQPGTGGAGIWLEKVNAVRSADINGDTCADAILSRNGHEPSLQVALGTPDGLDVAGAVTVPIPQAAGLGDDEEDEDRELVFIAAGLRHAGISQIILAGHHTWEYGNEVYGGYLDVLTLDDSLAVTATQIFEFNGVNEDTLGIGSALVTSGKTVAVGAPDTKVGGKSQAGAVRIYTRDSSDPTRLVLRTVLTQNRKGIPDKAEKGDRFGATLAMRDGRLAIGAPGEDGGKILNSGLVQPVRWNEAKLTWKAYRAITQNTKGVPGSNEKNDQFGSSLAIARGLTAKNSYDILIGAQESYGKRANAGSVTVANFTKKLFRAYTQASKGVPGNPQAGDAFYQVGVLQGPSGVDTVLIGSPGEASNGVKNVGRVVRTDGKKLTSKTVWTGVPVPANAPDGLGGWGLKVGG